MELRRYAIHMWETWEARFPHIIYKTTPAVVSSKPDKSNSQGKKETDHDKSTLDGGSIEINSDNAR